MSTETNGKLTMTREEWLMHESESPLAKTANNKLTHPAGGGAGAQNK